MLIKITDVCSMGCSHCMDDAKCTGSYMSIDTFRDIMEFCVRYDLGKYLVISGGEPTEHPQFEEIMNILYSYAKDYPDVFLGAAVTTNGVNILKEPEKYKKIALDGLNVFGDRCKILAKSTLSPNTPKTLMTMSFAFQVSTDVRYYPHRIDTTKRIFREPGFILMDDCVLQLVNMGRARTNKLKCGTRAPYCANMRLVTKQKYLKNSNKIVTLSEVVDLLLSTGKVCTPHINMKGDIKLGESHLCKKCASIYDTEEEIIDKIICFTCDGCNESVENMDIITRSLMEMPKKFLNADMNSLVNLIK